MNKDIKETTSDTFSKIIDNKISRKEAIKKTAYIAVSAATMMILLSKPDNAKADSPASSPAPIDPWTP